MVQSIYFATQSLPVYVLVREMITESIQKKIRIHHDSLMSFFSLLICFLLFGLYWAVCGSTPISLTCSITMKLKSLTVTMLPIFSHFGSLQFIILLLACVCCVARASCAIFMHRFHIE